MNIPHFELQVLFTSEDQLNKTVIALLEDELMWSFSVYPTADSAESHTLEIHNTAWAGNIVRFGEILSSICGSFDD